MLSTGDLKINPGEYPVGAVVNQRSAARILWYSWYDPYLTYDPHAGSITGGSIRRRGRRRDRKSLGVAKDRRAALRSARDDSDSKMSF